MGNAVTNLCSFVVREGWEQREDEGDYPRSLAQKALAEADSMRAEIAALKARAEKAEAAAEHEHAEMQRQAKLAVDWMIDAQRALAACAELRAVLERHVCQHVECSPIETHAGCAARALLSRTDFGRGVVVVPREVVERLGSVAESMRASYAVRPDENPIEEVLDVRRLLDAIDALLDGKDKL